MKKLKLHLRTMLDKADTDDQLIDGLKSELSLTKQRLLNHRASVSMTTAPQLQAPLGATPASMASAQAHYLQSGGTLSHTASRSSLPSVGQAAASVSIGGTSPIYHASPIYSPKLVGGGSTAAGTSAGSASGGDTGASTSTTGTHAPLFGPAGVHGGTRPTLSNAGNAVISGPTREESCTAQV